MASETQSVELGPKLGPPRAELMLQILLDKISDTQVVKTPFPHMRITNVFTLTANPTIFTDEMTPANDWPTTDYSGASLIGRKYMVFPKRDVGNIFADMQFMFQSQRLKEAIVGSFRGLDISRLNGQFTLLVEDRQPFEIRPHTGSGFKSFEIFYSAHGANSVDGVPNHKSTENKLHSQSIHSQQSNQKKAVADMATTVGYQDDRNSILMFPCSVDSWHSVSLLDFASGVRRHMLHYYTTQPYTRKGTQVQP